MRHLNHHLQACAYFTCLLLFGVTVNAAPAAFYSCTDYHCDEGRQVQLNEAQWQAVRALFTRVDSAAAERLQIRRAIALL